MRKNKSILFSKHRVVTIFATIVITVSILFIIINYVPFPTSLTYQVDFDPSTIADGDYITTISTVTGHCCHKFTIKKIRLFGDVAVVNVDFDDSIKEGSILSPVISYPSVSILFHSKPKDVIVLVNGRPAKKSVDVTTESAINVSDKIPSISELEAY